MRMVQELSGTKGSYTHKLFNCRISGMVCVSPSQNKVVLRACLC